jgi:hypothetical protein
MLPCSSLHISWRTIANTTKVQPCYKVTRVVCPAVVLRHHWTVVVYTMLVNVSHIHKYVSVDHVYSVQNEHTVTAMLLCLIAYWTSSYLNTRWDSHGGNITMQGWPLHLLGTYFHMDQLESEASTHLCWHTFVSLFMCIEHAPTLVPCWIPEPLCI